MFISNWFRLSTIRQRILVLPIVGIISLVFITGINWYLNGEKTRNMIMGDNVNSLTKGLLNMMILQERFIKTHNKDYLSDIEGYEKRIRSYLKKITGLTDDEGLLSKMRTVKGLEDKNVKIFNNISRNIREMDSFKENLNKARTTVDKLLYGIINAIDQEEANLIMEGEILDSTKSSLRKELMDFKHYQTERMMNLQDLLLFSDIKIYKQKRIKIEKILELKAGNISTLIENIGSDEFSENFSRAREIMKKMKVTEDKLFNLFQENINVLPLLDKGSSQIQKISDEVLKLMSKRIKDADRLNNILAAGAFIIFFVLLSGVSFFAVRSINRVLETNISKLDEGADQVSGAADQVSSTSQILAEGASEQAASVEETSSSLEEMASMTKQNADNASHAEKLMNEVSNLVHKADESMDKLIVAMSDISGASEETGKIIKTIDEIAFQTNLLALNAAVEAARAGEAGAGFAVVADEVRNLAMRAADAAKNTATIIEKTVKDVENGAELLEDTNNAFGDVTKSINKVSELLKEISSASSEQAQGIEQINKAISEMDSVIQRTASNAEEAASASEQLSSQARETKAIVKDLVSLIGGSISKYGTNEL